MPTKIPIPKSTELSEVYRTTDQLCQKLPNRRWIVQPKYDGSKCLLVPTEDGYVACTVNGNLIECLPKQLAKFNEQFGALPLGVRPVFEAEIEPEPWTQANKVKLNGNLYKETELPFQIKLSAYDCVSLHEFMEQTEQGMTYEERLATLAEYSPMLEQCGVKTSPYVTMTTEEVAKAFDQGTAEGKADHRVVFTPLREVGPVEGFVIRSPDSPYIGGRRNNLAIKLKPFVSLDILVTAVGKKENGMAVLSGIDTKDPTQPYHIFTGLPQEMRDTPTDMLGKIIEVEVLTTDDPRTGSGNPTFKLERPDKSYDAAVDPVVQEQIEKKIKEAGMQLLGSLPEIELN